MYWNIWEENVRTLKKIFGKYFNTPTASGLWTRWFCHELHAESPESAACVVASPLFTFISLVQYAAVFFVCPVTWIYFIVPKINPHQVDKHLDRFLPIEFPSHHFSALVVDLRPWVSFTWHAGQSTKVHKHVNNFFSLVSKCMHHKRIWNTSLKQAGRDFEGGPAIKTSCFYCRGAQGVVVGCWFNPWSET